jgi:hypothetical protein
MFGSLVNLS